MGKPSRLMPAAVATPLPISLRLAAGALAVFGLGCFAWAVWAKPVAVLAAAGAVILFRISVEYRQRKHLQALADSRQGESICTFVRALPFREMDSWVVRAVFDELEPYLHDGRSRVPIRPSDRLVADLTVDAEDLEDVLIPEIAQRTGRSLANVEHNPFYGRVVTVEDLIRFFCAQPRKGGAAEQGVEADKA